ncbi:MAG TPA: hypothetical protein VEC06_18865 [Paucimonas sp.]|nr:hypothetical protein [Paucimonas sp.]
MHRALKSFLIWLLLAALPIQGIAAAAMLSCRAMQSVAATPEAAHAEHAHHGNAAHAQHEAFDETALADRTDDADGAHSGHHSSGKHDASTSCSACAACCIGAAPLPAASNWAAVPNGSEAVVVAPVPLMTGFIPAGLERPPRFLA